MTFWVTLQDLTAGSTAIRAAAVAAATVVAGLLVDWTFRRVVYRVSRRTRTEFDDELGQILRPAVRNTVFLVGAGAAVRTLGGPPGVQTPLIALLQTVLVFLWASTIVRAVARSLRHFSGRSRFRILEPRTVPLFDTVQKSVVFAAALYAVFLIWNIDATAWLASAGIVGIAVGFAARDTIANLFAGIAILLDSPYGVGDMVVFENGDRGEVTQVGIRSTRILTRDDVEIIIPNAVIGSGRVTNESGGGKAMRRVDIRVSVSYSSDVDRVRRALLEVATQCEHVETAPEPRVRFRDMADSALVLSLLCWIARPQDRGVVIDALNTAVLLRFREDGIEIPFPQRVVHHVGLAVTPDGCLES